MKTRFNWLIVMVVTAGVILAMGAVVLDTSQQELKEAQEDTVTPEQRPLVPDPIAFALAALTAGVILLMKHRGGRSLPDPTCTQCNSVGYPTTHKGDKTIQCKECEKILYRQT